MIDSARSWVHYGAILTGVTYLSFVTGTCFAKPSGAGERENSEPVPLAATVVTGASGATTLSAAPAIATTLVTRPNMQGDDVIQVVQLESGSSLLWKRRG